MAGVPLGLATLVLLAGACGGKSGARGGASGAPEGTEAISGASGSVHAGLGGAPTPAGSGSSNAASGRGSGESASDGGTASSNGSAAEAGSGDLAGGGGGHVETAGHLETAGHPEMPPLTGGAGGSGGEAAGVCDSDALWAAITSQVIGACYPANAMLGPDEHLSPRRGTVVFDDQGRVIDNTGLTSLTKQQWLDMLSAQRWPCLAGQTIGYQCTVAG